MKIRSLLVPVVLAGAAAAQTAPSTAAKPAVAAPAGSPARIAVIQFQQAVLATQEGRQAAATMQSKYNPRKEQLAKRQADLAAMQKKLQDGGAAMAEPARLKLQSDITATERTLNRDVEDLNSEAQEEDNKLMQTLAAKMGDIIKNYATQHGYAVVLDVGGQNTPVLWADASANITADIVKLYDQAHPAAGPTAAPKPAAPKPAAPPAKK